MNGISAQLEAATGGRYRIDRELGAGGMATVYLAHDRRHDRQVAVKFLHPQLTAVLGVERFLQEIKVTASLQHPNILPLHDSGVAGGLLFYVMPYVEGETLRVHLARQKQLPVAEAVRLALEVAGALDYAHRRGVIHRDIKPENIMLQDGRALVADFGIALAVSTASGKRFTEAGMSLGTPQYMSPEQAMGEREIAPNSDVYSLGCVLYEMLTGEPPFTGVSSPAIIARQIAEPPRSLSARRRTVPPHVEAAIQVALEKLPADRFASAAEFASALTNPSFAQSLAVPGATETQVSGQSLNRTSLALGGIAVVLGALALWGWLRTVPAAAPITRAHLVFEEDQALRPAPTVRFALSPDGALLAYVGTDSGGTRLWIRRLDRLSARPLPGTAGAVAPFFSPDGAQIGFFAGQPAALKVIRVEGGPVRTLVPDSVSPWGGDWAADGWLYFTNASGAISRVREVGGRPETVSRIDSARGEREHDWVALLPNRRSALVEVWHTTVNDAQIGLLDLRTGRTDSLVNGVIARYASSGHLVFVSPDGKLWVARFDPDRHTLLGPPRPVLEGIAIDETSGGAEFSLSANGTLVYQVGGDRDRQQLVWVDRDGRAAPVDSGWYGAFNGVAVSPDGQRLAVSVRDGARSDIWVKRLDTGALTRLTFDGLPNYRPAWTPDGAYVTFISARVGNRQQLWRKRADGSAPAERIVSAAADVDEGFLARGGWIVYRLGASGVGTRDIFAIREGADTARRTLVATRADEYAPALSPDGRWLAYTSEESGRREVYVRPFPQTDPAVWQVSAAGGAEPVWSHSGREIFYRGMRGELISVPVAAGRTFVIGAARRVLPPSEIYVTDDYSTGYAVGRDDRRFVMTRRQLRGTQTGLVLVLHWFDELRAQGKR